jgi:S1-C subfamily serine protease|tara:strand:+ start:1571 stop:2287 length:717 start_codon:yes stop_codon:yes gene_type:complete
MKNFLLIINLLILFQSCENENGWYGEGINNNLHKEHEESKERELQKTTNTKTEKDLPSLLLNTSVSITNFLGKNELNTGSGAFISPSLVVTNYHVIEGGNLIELSRNSDKKLFKGKIKIIDRTHDVCILELVEEKVEEFLIINKNRPSIGTDIMVAGSPLGLNGTITKGSISRIARENPYEFEIFQITAPISPGSSGGPLVNLKGELIGIAVSSLVGQGIQNINFAVPSKYIYYLLDE